ncbi:MAG: hypothetical protein KF914_10010 [Rhizobiaceae bacterium]|nr:hypothetical protein [Rhizobiaceae bacterium]
MFAGTAHADFLPLKPSEPVGALAGEFEVDGNGNAVLKIPIEVPPGTGGFAPDLTVSYNSQQQNGIVGVGWTVTGLPQIARCPQTAAQDGPLFVPGITYNTTDRFCMYGERLIATRGAYGQPGTEYHTEQESWTRVTSLAADGRQCGSGPCAFLAITKSGTRIEFGMTADSRIEVANPQDGTVSVWAMNRITDRNGNYLTASYSEDTKKGQFRPDAIAYTGNASTGSGGPLAPLRHIRFDYGTSRGDATVTFVDGARFELSNLLTGIRTMVQSAPQAKEELVKQYRFAYRQSPVTRRSLLSSISECDGNTPQVCLPPTRFGWQAGVNGFANAPGTKSTDNAVLGKRTHSVDGDGSMIWFEDMDANGLPDLVYRSSGTFYVMLKRGSVYAGEVAWGKPPKPAGNGGTLQWFSDVNSDGLPDLLYQGDGKDKDRYFALLNTGTAFKPAQAWGGRRGHDVGNEGALQWVEDMNGDQLPDLVYQTAAGGSADLYVMLNRLAPSSGGQSGFQADSLWARRTQAVAEGGASQWFVDVTGDGLTDYLYHAEGGQKLIAIVNRAERINDGRAVGKETAWGTLGGSPYAATHALWAIDVNRDGITDLIYRDKDAPDTYHVQINTGLVFQESTGFAKRSKALASDATQWFGDMNGDGLVDYFYEESKSRTYWAMLSNGKTLPGTTKWGARTKEVKGPDPSLLDINDDSLPDLVYGSAKGDYLAMQSVPVFPDLMTSIADGGGAVTSIDYGGTSERAVYVRGSGATYPQVDIVPSNPVVASHTLTNDPAINSGVNYRYRYQYSYAAARIQVDGRGWLGFQRSTLIDSQSMMPTDTYYHQDFPFTGAIDRIVMRAQNGGTLQENRDTLECLSGGPNPSGCGVGSGAGYFAGVYQSFKTRDRRTIHGADYQPAYTLGNDYLYDDYQNLIARRELADVADPADDVLLCQAYANDAAGWVIGYLVAEKTVAPNGGDSRQLCAASHMPMPDLAAATPPAPGTWSWNPATDLRASFILYDGRGNIASTGRYLAEESRWLVVRAVWSDYGNVVSSTDEVGAQSLFFFDETYQTFAVQQQSPEILVSQNGAAISYRLPSFSVYDPRFGVVTKSTDANGITLEATFDGFGRQVEGFGPSPTDPRQRRLLGLSRSVARNGALYIETKSLRDWDVADPGQWPWQRVYADGMGRKYATKISGPSDQVDLENEEQFDARGRPTAKSLPAYTGQTKNYVVTAYDDYNQPISITYPGGGIQNFAYDIAGRTMTEYKTDTDSAGPREQTTVYSYDARGNTVKIDQANGGRKLQAYDLLGQLMEKRDASNSRTVYAYDSLGRMIRTEDDSTGTMLYRYDDADRLLSRTDANLNQTSYNYDALGRIVRRWTGTTSSTSVSEIYAYDGYDINGFQTPFANAKGNLTQIYVVATGTRYDLSNDAYGNLTNSTVWFNNRMYQTTSVYDAAGALTELTFPNQISIRNEYDRQGYTHKVRMKRPTDAAPADIATFDRYTASGDYVDAVYGNGNRATYGYEILGRISTARMSNARGDILLSNSFDWDTFNKLHSITDGLNPQNSQRFTYNVMGWLQAASGSYGSASYDYNLSGDLKSIGGWTLDADPSKPHRLVGRNRPGVPQRLAIGYDAAGNSTSKQIVAPDGSVATRGFSYDSLGQLTAVSLIDASGQVKPGESYTYDPFGNRLSKTDSRGTADPSDDVASFYISGGFEITVYPDPQTGQRMAVTTVSIAGPRGVLATVTSEPEVFQAAVDPGSAPGGGGRRFADAGTAGIAAAQLGAVGTPLGWLWLSVLPVLLALCGARRPRWRGMAARFVHVVVAFCYVTVYVLGQTLPASAELTPAPNGPGVPTPGLLYLHQDHVLSTNLVTDEAGQVTARINYAPFGAIDPGASGGFDNFRPKFSGKEWDGGSALYYFGSRYYDPELGRFNTPDPAGQFDSPYVYADDNPEVFIDPDGEFAMALGILTGMVVAAVIGAYASTVLATGEWNPAKWNWKTGEVWEAIGIGALLGAGFVLSFAVPQAGVALDLVFLAYDSYKFARNPTLENAAFVGMDVVSLGLASAASRAARAGRAAGGAAEELAEAGTHIHSGCSFPAGTLIATPAGPEPIETVAPGDTVYGFDESRGASGAYKVLNTFGRVAAALTVVTLLGGETIAATPEHPFLVEGRGWVEAGELEPGVRLATRASTPAVVETVQQQAGSQHVYNFEVEVAHNYYVGTTGLLVHNAPHCEYRSAKLVATKGSKTTEKMRKYVNSKSTKVPYKIEIELTYISDDKTQKVRSMTVDNPKSGEWDAGHLRGFQNGGSGKIKINIVPQNKYVNRWKVKGSKYVLSGYKKVDYISSKNKKPYRSWRDFEDKINRKIAKYGDTSSQFYNGSVSQKVTLFYH